MIHRVTIKKEKNTMISLKNNLILFSNHNKFNKILLKYKLMLLRLRQIVRKNSKRITKKLKNKQSILQIDYKA